MKDLEYKTFTRNNVGWRKHCSSCWSKFANQFEACIIYRLSFLKLISLALHTKQHSLQYYNQIEYLKDSDAALHSVDSDIFYAVIHLPAYSKTYNNLYFLKYCQIMGSYQK